MHGTWQVLFPSMWIYWAENFSANAASNCVCTPPKPPLLMHTMVSLGCTAAITCCTKVAILSAVQPSGPQRLQRLGRVPIQPRRVAKARSASFKAQGSWAFMVPSFMVLLRGSKTAKMRFCWPICWRSPSKVVRMAVGWWAKSSYSAIPATVPRNSIRRRTF